MPIEFKPSRSALDTMGANPTVSNAGVAASLASWAQLFVALPRPHFKGQVRFRLNGFGEDAVIIWGPETTGRSPQAKLQLGSQ